MIESLLSGTAIAIVEKAIKAGQYAAQEVRGAYKDVDHKQQLIAASNAYIDNYQNRHCQIKILPGLMKEPLALESIYTDVKILDDRGLRAFIGLDALEAAYREKGARGGWQQQVERRNGMTVANEKRCLMVLGGPGIGKSTFLRKIGLEALKKDGALKRECIPVFLELKRFREETIDIKRMIVDEFDICNFPAAAAFVDAALAQGKLLVLFDGLDEVPSKNLNRVIEKIEDFVDKYGQKSAGRDHQNSFVASCRIAAYRSSFRRFTDVTISEFDDEQIKQFIHRWFGSQEDKALGIADEYIALLNQGEHRATKDLAQTPLLLTFLCLVYDREQTLPHERTTLYGRALNIILNEWAAQKRIERDPIYKGFHIALEQVMLAEIAYDSFKKNQLFFSKDAVTSQITDFLTETLDAPKHLNADAVLEAIEVQQGILVQRATDAYSFSHLTLQEYLTALHIVRNRLEDDLVTHHLTEDSWREVFLLVSGLMENQAIKLLEAIERQVLTDIGPYPKLQALIKWAEVNKRGPSELYQRAASLAIAIISASARLLVRVSSGDSASANNASAIARAIDSASAIASAIASASDIASARAINSASARAINSASTNAIARAVASARAIDSVIDSASDHHFFNADTFNLIAEKLSHHRQVLPKPIDPSEEWRTWAEQLDHIWLDALGVSRESISFSRSETMAWKNYFYANELLLRCKQSAIRVPRTDWEKIEKRLLTSDSNSEVQ